MIEEITLRDLINRIIKRKWIICIITAIAFLLSGIYSLFIMEPVYSASATLLTSPISGKNIDMTDGINEMINSLALYPNMTTDMYKEQVKAYAVLTETISELNLTDDQGEPMQWDMLAQKISTAVIANTNLLRITVEDKDSVTAAKIANSVADNFIEYISNITKDYGKQATAIIEESLKEEEAKLQEQAKKLQDYLANSHNIEQIKLEIQSLFDKVNTYEMELIDVEKQIQTDKETLKVLLGDKDTFSTLDLYNDIKLNLPLDNDDIMESIEISINSSDKLQNALVTIKATEIESRLIQNLADKKSLEDKITELEVRLKDTQALLADEEYKYNTIIRNYNLAEQTYNAYLDRHKEAVLAATSNIGESAIIVASQAQVPLEPSSRGKLFYLALGTLFGLFAGIFIASIIAYFDITDSMKNKKEYTG